MIVSITGATGFIGRRLVQRLRAGHGHYFYSYWYNGYFTRIEFLIYYIGTEISFWFFIQAHMRFIFFKLFCIIKLTICYIFVREVLHCHSSCSLSFCPSSSLLLAAVYMSKSASWIICNDMLRPLTSHTQWCMPVPLPSHNACHRRFEFIHGFRSISENIAMWNLMDLLKFCLVHFLHMFPPHVFENKFSRAHLYPFS